MIAWAVLASLAGPTLVSAPAQDHVVQEEPIQENLGFLNVENTFADSDMIDADAMVHCDAASTSVQDYQFSPNFVEIVDFNVTPDAEASEKNLLEKEDGAAYTAEEVSDHLTVAETVAGGSSVLFYDGMAMALLENVTPDELDTPETWLANLAA